MTDPDHDDLAKLALAADREIARCETQVRALWADITGLARLGNTAAAQYQCLAIMEGELERWKLLRERICAMFTSVGR